MTIDDDALPQLKRRITQKISAVLVQSGYAVKSFHVESIVSDTQVRNGIVRETYMKLRQDGMRNKDAAREIEERFNIGESYLKKIMSEK